MFRMCASSHHLFRINSGAIRFKARGIECKFWLVSRLKPYKNLYQVRISMYMIIIKNLSSNNEVRVCTNVGIYQNGHDEFIQYSLSWYNGRIQISREDNNDIYAEYIAEDLDYHNDIGFLRCYVPCTRFSPVNWIIEAPPFKVIPSPTSPKIEEGKLYWRELINDQLPPEALIGGFENECTYIARAFHNGSLCPGRYVPSKGAALIPWGFEEHRKHTDVEVLCGYNAEWVETSGNFVPENALVAGYSEVRGEPLYIGRAMILGNLLTGKVHPLYKACYLPFEGKEVMVTTYEILIQPYIKSRGVLPDSNQVCRNIQSVRD